jgi:ankyrin repeat protein
VIFISEHRDKKGFTPLILAATAGHEKVVEILLTHGADIEAQSERTKDTPLSLACSGGRYEVRLVCRTEYYVCHFIQNDKKYT